MTATTFLLLAAAVSVALLLVLHLRLNRRQDALHVRMVGFEQTHKTTSADLKRRAEDLATRVGILEEGVSAKFETLDGRLNDIEEHVLSALQTLEEMGDATEAAKDLKEAKARLDEIASTAETRFSGMQKALDDAGGRVSKVEAVVDHTHQTLDQRLTALERRVTSLRAGTSPRFPSAPRPPSSPGPSGAAAGDGGGDRGPAGRTLEGSALAARAASPAASPAADAAERLRVEDEGLLLEGEVDAPVVPAVRGLLILVAMLAGLMMLFHWLGVGQ